jgi:hypothetical protein
MEISLQGRSKLTASTPYSSSANHISIRDEINWSLCFWLTIFAPLRAIAMTISASHPKLILSYVELAPSTVPEPALFAVPSVVRRGGLMLSRWLTCNGAAIVAGSCQVREIDTKNTGNALGD